MTQLVSILIPAYRASRFIAQTIDCVRAQTWPRKEIIIVDDGSPDATYEVAKRFEAADLKVIRQDNSGAPTARNAAYALAQGDYIQWLDADDLLHPHKISRQMEGADSGASSLVLRTCSWGKFFFSTQRAKFVSDALWRDHEPVGWIIARFSKSLWMNPAVWLVSRRLCDAGGPWDARLARSGDDDGEYICRVVARSERVVFVPEARCYYRIGTVGSLNWNMETNEKALESLALSLRLSVGHLLRLEDSPRTREAAVRHMEHFLGYFYGSDGPHARELSAYAATLGHELKAPSVNWKYRPVELIMGRRAARQLVANWRAWKLLILRRYDEFHYKRERAAAGGTT
jgi:glycosyltransferase involved in cell wall biosynthesis